MKRRGDLVLYRFFDDDDELLYIGKSIRVWSRFVSHQQSRVFYPEAAKVTLQRGFASHDDLLIAERAAILAEQPKFNEMHKNPARWQQDPINGCFCGPDARRGGGCCRTVHDRRDFDVVTGFLQGITSGGVSCCGCPLDGVQLGDEQRQPTRPR